MALCEMERKIDRMRQAMQAQDATECLKLAGLMDDVQKDIYRHAREIEATASDGIRIAWITFADLTQPAVVMHRTKRENLCTCGDPRCNGNGNGARSAAPARPAA